MTRITSLCVLGKGALEQRKRIKNRKVVGVIRHKEKTEQKVLEFMRHDDQVSHVWLCLDGRIQTSWARQTGKQMHLVRELCVQASLSFAPKAGV